MKKKIATIVCLFVAACGQTAAPAPQDAPLEMSATDQRLADIEARLQGLESRIGDTETAAFISVTGDSGYAAIHTSHGPLFFMLEEARVQGDGQAITLRVGNPSTATLSGLKFNVTWGPSFGTTRADDAPPLAPIEQRRRDVSIAQDLRPGSWTIVRFNIGPVRSEDFGTLFIRDVTLEQVALRNPG